MNRTLLAKVLHYQTFNSAFRKYSTDSLKVEFDKGVRRIIMIDRKTRNSLTLPMTESLIDTISSDNNNLELRCIVISAQGDVFSAGHNLKQLAEADGGRVFSRFSALMMAMIKCPVPIITAVDGLAAAAGCQLVAQSDITVCTEKSTFSTPGANFGIFCSTPGIPLSRCVPPKLSAYMLFTGYPITSAQALQYGLVSRVTAAHELYNEVDKITDGIKSKSRAVLELGKTFFYEQMDLPLEAAYKKGASVMSLNLKLKDGEEGLKSFREKRKPQWKHTDQKT